MRLFKIFLSILERRYPLTEVIVYPARVQGAGAAESVCKGIEAINRLVTEDGRRVDVLIVGRGGGSLEDLWAFNEEPVARAIFDSEIPVVSAVGHETDVTIADFVADVRAATPSMAAEIVTPNGDELKAYLEGAQMRATDSMLRMIEQHRQYITGLTNRYGFNRPVDQLAQFRQRLDDLTLRLKPAGNRYISRYREKVEQLQRQLQLVDPAGPLKKGYARVEQDGRFVRSANEIAKEHDITLRFHDGKRIVKRID